LVRDRAVIGRGVGAPVGRCEQLAGVVVGLEGDFLTERSHHFPPREVLDRPPGRGQRHVVYLADLGEFLQDEVAPAVAVEKRGHRSVAGQVRHRVGDVRPFDRDGVFDAVA